MKLRKTVNCIPSNKPSHGSQNRMTVSGVYQVSGVDISGSSLQTYMLNCFD